jgi:hypothetical protein
MKSELNDKDWLNDYPSLKQVAKNNPFTVPDGYFDAMHQSAMSRAFLGSWNTETGFTVPANYFEELPGQVQSRIVVEEALENEAKGFTVPANYFEDMQASLQSRINIEEALQHISGDFTIPANYFEDLQASLQSRINVEETLQHTNGDFTVPADFFEDQRQQITGRIAVEEILNGQSDGFTVPNNYFDSLQDAILAKTTSPAVKRDAVIKRLVNSGVFKYAAAACFVMAIGGTIFFNKYESAEAVHNRSYIHKALATVPDAAIIDYLQTHMDAADTPTLLDDASQSSTGTVTVDDLQRYLSTH